ncbi:MAG: hypothetical protein C4297_13170 [Gemmataceae bacterium]
MIGTPDGCLTRASLYVEGEKEALKHKWIESEKAGRDLGEEAIRQWVNKHWWGYFRHRWVEHLQGKRFWIELSEQDFGLLQREFQGQELLLDLILDRVKCGWENLNIIWWAQEWGLPCDQVIRILERLDINGRRLAYQFGSQSSR